MGQSPHTGSQLREHKGSQARSLVTRSREPQSSAFPHSNRNKTQQPGSPAQPKAMGLGQPRGQGGHMPPDSGPHASESPGPGILLDYRGSLQPPTEGRRCTQPHFHGCPPSPVLLESAIEHRLWPVPRLRTSWSLALAQQSTAAHPSAGAQAQGASTEMAPGWSH